MISLKILALEDAKDDKETLTKTVKRINSGQDYYINLEIVENLEKAIEALDPSYDGAIVDLKIKGDDSVGSEFVKKIKNNFNVPTVVFTATPDAMAVEEGVVVYKKGEIKLDYIFKYFADISKTGITRILGGRGLIEKSLKKIFWENFVPNANQWLQYSANGINTEKSILKIVTNQLNDLIHSQKNVEGEFSLGEEMYITPIDRKFFSTGSLVSKEGKTYVVLSPSCDMVVYKVKDGDGKDVDAHKTDRVLLCEIVSFDSVAGNYIKEPSKEEKRKKRIEEVIKNNYTNYYHWLPKYKNFLGGFINFRFVIGLEGFINNTTVECLNLKIASPYVKDIVSRFSSYYARQGQPNFSYQEISDELYAEIFPIDK